MTGPECYQEALRLIGEAHENQFHNGSGDPVTSELLAEAQVHATLALAAATALGHWTPDGTMPQPDRMDWWRAASGEPAERQRVKEAKVAETAEFAAEATA